MRILSGLLLCLCCCPSLTYALTDAQTVPLLHAMGEYRAAYPLALNEAKRQNTLAAWAAVYQQPEYAELTAPMNRAMVYAEAWQAAQHTAQIDSYRQFIALAPASVGAQLALEAEYALVKQQNTLVAYAEFMAVHSDAVQALDAMLRLQALIWAQVKTENTVAAYDNYLDAFPDSKFAAEAEQQAQALTVQEFTAEVTTCRQNADRLRQEKIQRNEGLEEANDEAEKQLDRCQEKLARKAFVLARKAQAARTSLRLYAFLDNEPAFTNTLVMTAHLDRQERQAHEAKLIGLLQNQLAAQQAQTTQLLAALETQTQRLEASNQQQTQVLSQVIETQTQRLESATERQTQRLEAADERQTQRLESAQARSTQAITGTINASSQRLEGVINSNAARLEKGIDQLRHSMAVGNMCPDVGPGPLALVKTSCVLLFDSAARQAVVETVTHTIDAAKPFFSGV